MWRQKIATVLVIVVVVLVSFFYSYYSAQQHTATVRINAMTISVEVARTPKAQAQGLSNRASLPVDHGMLFIFPDQQTRFFWMKEMRFPIDIIWISGETVVGIIENAPLPIAGAQLPIYNSPPTVDRVLEVNAGMAHQWGVRVGSAVAVE